MAPAAKVSRQDPALAAALVRHGSDEKFNWQSLTPSSRAEQPASLPAGNEAAKSLQNLQRQRRWRLCFFSSGLCFRRLAEKGVQFIQNSLK